MEQTSHLHRPVGLLVAALAVLMLARQDTGSTSALPTIAFIGTVSESDDASFAAFRAALVRAWPANGAQPALRYHEGSDLDPARLRHTVAAAIAQRPTLLVLPTGDSAAAAAAMPHDVPVVFASYLDPVRNGIVDSSRRPGHRTTGVSLADNLDLKRLELVKDAFPHLRTVALLTDSTWRPPDHIVNLARDAEDHLGLYLKVHQANTTEELEVLLSSPLATACDAWYIPSTYIAYLAEARIISHLRRLRLPAIHATEDEVAAGALMAYSQDTSFTYDAMADLTRRVALGEDAGSIPVQRPYRYTLSVRIEPDAPWARIEPSVVRRADRVHRP
jgi:putative tryptophan/tyrosine transport system substrate-binding protein